ncbi:MAG TPA: hypothetical protein VFU23_07115, partial [Gemmatimonadales bacterium]|nr:hypothetical protein [Gemmatimonadales bacterium]
TGIWGADLAGAAPITPWRRNLQRVHLARLQTLMTQEPPPPPPFPGAPAAVLTSISDIRPLVRAQLTSLRSAARLRAARTTDPITRAHLEDVVARIGEILEPRR